MSSEVTNEAHGLEDLSRQIDELARLPAYDKEARGLIISLDLLGSTTEDVHSTARMLVVRDLKKWVEVATVADERVEGN
jgi:hypothetical protein